MDAYVSKPLRPDDLLATIDGLFAPEQARGSIDGPTLVAISVTIRPCSPK